MRTKPLTDAERYPGMKGAIPRVVDLLTVTAAGQAGRTIRAEVYSGDGIFNPSRGWIEVAPNTGSPQSNLAEIARAVFALLSGDREGKKRERRIRESLLDLFILGRAVTTHLRDEMLARENTRALFDEIYDAVEEAKKLLVEEFGIPEGGEHGEDLQSVQMGDAAAPAPGADDPGADHHL